MVSTTAVMETQFAEQFKEFISAELDEGVRAIREQAFKAFTSLAYPTPGDEDWKYTSVTPIAKKTWALQAPGRNAPAVDTEALRAFNYMRNGFAALNLAFANVQVVRIAS